jgi:hypothetical protein
LKGFVALKLLLETRKVGSCRKLEVVRHFGECGGSYYSRPLPKFKGIKQRLTKTDNDLQRFSLKSRRRLFSFHNFTLSNFYRHYCSSVVFQPVAVQTHKVGYRCFNSPLPALAFVNTIATRAEAAFGRFVSS